MMNYLDSVRRGLIAALPVCLIVTAILLVRADDIEKAVAGVPVGLGGTTIEGWIGTWIILTMAFGVVATAAYDYLSMRWGWNGNEYLMFAGAMAVALSALAFLRIYNGEMHPFRIEYSALNFVYAFGFGIAVPVLFHAPNVERAARTRTGQAPQ